MAGNITKRPDGAYLARFRDPDGKEHGKRFRLKKEAQGWLDERVTAIGTGTYVPPDRAKMTVSQWCDEWLKGYTGRSSTIRQAESHVKIIKAGFDGVRLRDVRPSMVKTWTKTLAETRKPSTVYAIYARFSQVMTAAHRDGLIYRSPCSREVAPPMGKQRPYVATAAQVQAIHDAFPEHLRPAVALAAFAGLRVAEVAGLRVQDVDVDEGMIYPSVQHGDRELKSTMAATPLPIPLSLASYLAAAMGRFPGETVVTDGMGGSTSPWAIERAMRAARVKIEGLPEGFRFHDLRHFYATVLLGAGLDVKTVQVRVRHASATTTLNTYGHLLPDSDHRTRDALESSFGLADNMRTPAALEGAQPEPG